MARADLWQTWVGVSENLGGGSRKRPPEVSLTFKNAQAGETRTFSMDIDDATKLHRRLGAMLKAAKTL